MKWYYPRNLRNRYLPAISPIIYYFSIFRKKDLGTEHHFFYIIRNGYLQQRIPQAEYDRIGRFILKRLLNDPLAVKKARAVSDKVAGDFLKFCRQSLVPEKLTGLSDRQLIRALYVYFDFFQKYSLVNVPFWYYFQDTLNPYLASLFKNKKIRRANEALALLTTPNELSYVKKEELALIDLALKIKLKKIGDFSRLLDFKKIVAGYFWLPFDQVGPGIFSAKDFSARVKKLLRKDLNELKNQREEILDFQVKLAEEQKALTAKLRLDKKTKGTLEATKETAILQDDKKKTNSESQYYLQNIFRELARRTGYHYSDFYFLLNEEAERALIEKQNLKLLARSRRRLSLTLSYQGKIEIFTGQEAISEDRKNGWGIFSEKISAVKTLKGAVGSTGRARGKVRIINQKSEMKNFKAGEILVTSMTTPDFVFIMKKAGAIVTDEGGMTCHAAIISRELGLPCVIGTKIATRVFKDGDLVQVDADKGIVKKIK